jgi:transposase
VSSFEQVVARLDAAVSRIESLETELGTLRSENKNLKDKVADLESKLTKSQREGKRQAAPFRRRKRIPKSEQKKPGRKSGHDGSSREIPDEVDETVFVPLDCCPDCAGDLEDRRNHEHYVTDIPPILPVTKKFITESGNCPNCQQRWNSSHPDLPSHATGAAGVMVGNRAVALAAQMRLEFGAPLRKIAGYLSSALGLPISASGVLGLLKRASRSLEATSDDLEQQLQKSPRVCADETGWRVACDSAWAWVFTSCDTTLYKVDKSRGHQVVLDVLGRDFEGVLQSDCFLAYRPLPYEKAKCLAHLLKALKDVEAIQNKEDQRFSRAAITLLKSSIELGKRRLHYDYDYGTYRNHCFELEKRLDRLLDPDYSDTSNARLAKRIGKYRDEWFVFLYNTYVQPTNNQAERQIRPFVLIRKISAGNRSQWGANLYAQLMSVFSTCNQRGKNFVQTVIEGLIDPENPHLTRI